MRQNPTPEERVKNAALFLCLAEQLAQDGVIGDRLKVQKCTFLVTLDQFEKRLKGFNLTFFRYKMGPLSRQVYDIVDMLKAAGLVDSRGTRYYLTEQGLSFALQFCAELWADPQNKPFHEQFVAVGNQFGTMSSSGVKDYVYSLTVTPIGGQEQAIRDMPEGLDITQVLDPDEATREIVIPQGWLETLAIMASPESRRGLEQAERELAAGKTLSHAEVWV